MRFYPPKKPEYMVFPVIDMQPFVTSVLRYGTSIAEYRARARERQLNRQGISTGYAPAPYSGTDI